MAITLSNFSKNIIVLTNDDVSLPVYYTIRKMGDEGTFAEIVNYPATPTTILAAGASVTVDLVTDGVYQIEIDASPSENILYYFLVDFLLKTCGKEIMEEILCDTCGQTDACGKQAHYLKLEKLMKYSSIKESLYYIWNEIVQTQSVTDLIAADSAKLLFLSDLVSKLELICDNCKSDDICRDVYDSSGNPTGNCGCC